MSSVGGPRESLSEAAAETERAVVLDARGSIWFRRSVPPLDRGEPAVAARAQFDEARREPLHGSPPMRYAAVLDAFEARLIACERGLVAGLRAMAAALRAALRRPAAGDAWCADCVRPVPEVFDARNIEARGIRSAGEQESERAAGALLRVDKVPARLDERTRTLISGS